MPFILLHCFPVPHRLSRQFSRESSGSSFDDSFQESLPKVIQVARGRGGFGFSFRALKVLNEVTGKYSLEHVVVVSSTKYSYEINIIHSYFIYIYIYMLVVNLLC